MSPARTCRRARWTPAADRHPAFRRRGGARRGRAVGGPVVLDAELPEDGYDVLCLSSAGRPVSCAKGLVLQAHADMAEAGELAVLLHPGGRGTRGLMVAPGHLAWVQHQRRKVPLLTSVCSGALVYAAAGLLAGRPATTHRSLLDRLAEVDPTIDVRRDERWVDAGDVITSAGIAAGIDMALHLVARLASKERSAQVRRGIEY